MNYDVVLLELTRLQSQFLESREILAEYPPYEKVVERAVVAAGLNHVEHLMNLIRDLETLQQHGRKN